MVEAVSYKSPHAVLEMLRKKKEETAFDKLRIKSTAKRRWISLDIELQKDIKLIKWYATKNGFYLGTDAYYMVKFRIRQASSEMKALMLEYREVTSDLRAYRNP